MSRSCRSFVYRYVFLKSNLLENFLIFQVFGFKVVEIEAKSGKTYMLINLYEQDSEARHLSWSTKDNKKMGLLMTTLAMIYMNSNVVRDDELYFFLKTVGINVEKVHPEFGDVKKLLTKEFVQKKYLEVSVISIGNDQTALEFRWGQRAKEETTKKEVLDFVCTVCI